MTPRTTGRILRRSLTGGTLILAVAGLLWWTNGSSDGRPLLYVTAAILLGVIFEVSRMGTLALRDLLPSLLLPASGVLLLLLAAIEGPGRNLSLTTDPGPAYRANLAIEYAWCAALAASAYSLGRALSSTSRSVARLSRALVYLVLGFVVVWAAEDPLEVYQNLRLAWLPLGIVLAILLYPTLRQPGGARGLAIAVGLAVWIAPPLPALWQVWRLWSTGGLVAFLLCAKIGDTAGYYVGTALGRRHPFPRISPGKTVEGCLGSFAAGTAAGGAAVLFGLLPGGIAGGLAAGAVVNLAAQAGDLLESWVKRRAGVKDSSTVFGPSGGLLDQVDSLLLAVPVAVVSWPWILGAPAGSH